jgi:hypothetical protein
VTSHGFFGRFGLDQHRLAMAVVVLADLGDREAAGSNAGSAARPGASSSSAMRRLSFDFGMASARPACEKPPCSTTMAK